MRSFKVLAACFVFFSFSSRVWAQAVYTATRGGRIQAGGGLLYLNNDYSQTGDEGISAWADVDLNRHLGVEAEVHLGTLRSPSDYGENSYLIGPRLSLQRGRFTGYGKAMFGRGSFVYDRSNTSLGYFVLGFGGGLDYRLGNRFSVRAVDFEVQHWGSFPPNGLSPYMISTGILYRIR